MDNVEIGCGSSSAVNVISLFSKYKRCKEFGREENKLGLEKYLCTELVENQYIKVSCPLFLGM